MQTSLKIYYHLVELLYLKRISNQIQSQIPTKKLFLYFDYEREFSGFKTEITNQVVKNLIDKLESLGFKGTWFTVGKVIENYPETIDYLIEKGHEIGSHTYAHISPQEISELELLKDLKSFESVKQKHRLKIKGFHSPKDRWNLKMFDHLSSFGYSYDVFPPKQNKNIASKLINYFKKGTHIRLVTLGDDWVLYDQKKSQKEVFNYFVSLFNQMEPGYIRGIGAHPWVLYSDPNIWNGYLDFLEYLSKEENLEIRTASEFIERLV